MSLDVLLARPGLPASLRLLVVAASAVWRGDWPALHECTTRLRGLGADRAEIEETLLQTVLFCGFPRVVTAFETLATAWPVAVAPTGGALPVADQADAGKALFASIYGQNTAAVDTMLRGFHADFHAFVFEVAYGRILTRPRLSARIRELLAVGLLAAQDQVRQFAGHARGAMHFGASRDELREVVVTALGNSAEADSWCARIR